MHVLFALRPLVCNIKALSPTFMVSCSCMAQALRMVLNYQGRSKLRQTQAGTCRRAVELVSGPMDGLTDYSPAISCAQCQHGTWRECSAKRPVVHERQPVEVPILIAAGSRHLQNLQRLTKAALFRAGRCYASFAKETLEDGISCLSTYLIGLLQVAIWDHVDCLSFLRNLDDTFQVCYQWLSV